MPGRDLVLALPRSESLPPLRRLVLRACSLRQPRSSAAVADCWVFVERQQVRRFGGASEAMASSTAACTPSRCKRFVLARAVRPSTTPAPKAWSAARIRSDESRCLRSVSANRQWTPGDLDIFDTGPARRLLHRKEQFLAFLAGQEFRFVHGVQSILAALPILNVAESRWARAVSSPHHLLGLAFAAVRDAPQRPMFTARDGVAAIPELGRDAAVRRVLQHADTLAARDLPRRSHSRTGSCTVCRRWTSCDWSPCRCRRYRTLHRGTVRPASRLTLVMRISGSRAHPSARIVPLERG
jgi:hypothetical protein